MTEVKPLLLDNGADVLHFDPGTFPSRSRIVIGVGKKGLAEASFLIDDHSVAISSIDLVWNRVRSRSVAADKLNPDQRLWSEEACTRFLAYVYELIRCPWIPYRPISSNSQFVREAALTDVVLEGQRCADCELAPSPENKIHQLLIAHSLGFEIPDSLITNEPSAFLDFYRSKEGRLISKRVVDMTMKIDSQRLSAFTHKVSSFDLLHASSLTHSPAVFQENIEKQVEVRVTVMGEKVFAVEIYSQRSERQSTDWRHYPVFGMKNYHGVHCLPREEEERCIAMISALGLRFGGIDLILHPSRGYVFLEVNPNAQWAWLEDVTGLPMVQAFADFLLDQGRQSVDQKMRVRS